MALNSFELLLLFVAVSTCQILKPPTTVDEIDLDLYDGLWYLTHTTRFVMATYQRNGVCGTASYKICDNQTMGVYNHQRLKTPDGKEDSISGIATITDKPGKLKLKLDGVPQGDYWVMKLGPVRKYSVLNENNLPVLINQYAYSLVTDPTRLNMFVIARDRIQFKIQYEAEVLEYLRNNGFKSILNKPVEFYHDITCQYVEKNPPFTC